MSRNHKNSNASEKSTICYKEKTMERGLPKNIRQIGEPKGDKKIYVEDYVVTYLNQLAHPTNSVARCALLLGEYAKIDSEQVLFISGAIEAENIVVNVNDIAFSEDAISSLSDQIQCYFDGLEIVGWFVSRLGYSIRVNESMKAHHRRHFPKEGSVLYLMDALEQEDAFYRFQNDQLVTMDGYYIYYERNAMMQNYLVENQSIERNSPAERRIEYKDGQLLHNYHEMLTKRQARREERRLSGLLYVSSAMLVIVFLALGINIFNNYDKLKTMQSTLDKLMIASGATTEAPENSMPAASEVSGSLNEDSEEQAKLGPGDVSNETNENLTSNSEASQETVVTKNEAASQKSNKVVAAASIGNQNYYTVQAGDTLLSISEKVYHSGEYVDMLRNANKLNASDLIYPGQRILVPEVN